MIGFWDFKLSGAPALLSFGVRLLNRVGVRSGVPDKFGEVKVIVHQSIRRCCKPREGP
jgi:hypothetical protein